jgi:hypothetical protein
MDFTFPIPFVLYARGGMVKPKKSNSFGYLFCEYPLKLTILLFSICNVNLHVSMRSLICRSMNIDCFSVLQCTIKRYLTSQKISNFSIQYLISFQYHFLYNIYNNTIPFLKCILVCHIYFL